MKSFIILIVCSFSGYLSVQGDVNIDISVSSESISRGGTVDVTCKVNEYPENSPLVSWYKRQGKEHIVQLGTNNELSDTFTDTSRYTARKIDEGGAVSYIITITGAVAEDSGEIGCEIKSLNIEKKFASVLVTVPVSEVHLYGLNDGGSDIKEYKDGEIIEFFDGEKFFFRCEASGSNPEPKFDITFDGESMIDKFDYNSSYEVKGGQPGLKQVIFNAKSTTRKAVVISTSQNALDFTCAASVDGTEAKSITIKPTLSFRPQIMCDVDSLFLPVLTMNVELECTVKSDPQAYDIYLFWTTKHGANTTLRKDSEDPGHYRMRVEDGDRNDEKKIIFTVDRLFPQTFRKYILYAINSEGTSTRTITLIRDTSKDNGSGQIQASITLMALLFSLVWVW